MQSELFIAFQLCQLLLVRYAALIPQVDADCNGNVTLPCPAVNQENMDFLALAWYKEDSNGKRHGIIRKSDDGVMAFENGRTASFGTMHSLLLNWVNASDEGTYLCAMSANVGGQNKDARVELTVRVCRTEVQLTTVNYVTSSRANQTSQVCNEVHIPQTWSLLGFGAVAAVKILLSIITIKVIRSRCLKRRRS
uniref:Ig-like domain-containing protein n=1 Tax=Oryzias latipes TaxID=8090 RepID=A0A3B3HS09_ORYLA